jgi:hypothetical protein
VKYGNVRGRVTDVSGAIVSGARGHPDKHGERRLCASLALTKRAITSLPRSTRAHIRCPSPPRISRGVEHQGVIVDLEQTATVDENLAVGTVGETVEVSGAGPLIDTATASEGQVITEEQVQDLPNQGRNPFTVNKLDNNVTPVGDPRFVRYEDQNGTDSQSGCRGSNRYERLYCRRNSDLHFDWRSYICSCD